MKRIRPERRTRLDLIVSALIVVVLIVGAVAVWSVSPARHTTSEQAHATPAAVEPAAAVPASFTPRWHAASGATTVPAVAASTIITADGGTVTGRDPSTGGQLWTYSRDAPLCTAVAAWPDSLNEAIAVYRNSRGCSEVTALDAATGGRKGARTSDADDEVTVTAGSGYVLAQGSGRLETWGSNLVRGIEYGRVTAPVKPGVQPGRSDCHLYSAAIAGDRIAVIERCAGDTGYRLTVLGAVLDSDERVSQYGSSLITDRATGAPPVVIGMSTSAIAVYDGGANAAAPTPPSVRQFGSDGAQTGSNTVNGLASPPADSVALTSGGLVTYFTGTDTLVLDAGTMRPKYQVPAALGPGEMMGDELLLPGPSGISVRNPATGEPVRTIPLTRHDYQGGVISLRVLGDKVIEQRGGIVEAFAPQS